MSEDFAAMSRLLEEPAPDQGRSAESPPPGPPEPGAPVGDDQLDIFRP